MIVGVNETGNPTKTRVGVGMPEALHLAEFGQRCTDAFGYIAYHVGSSLTGKTWRDVDVRVMIPDSEYEAMRFGDPLNTHSNPKWVALCLAFSALGRIMTGLPIDFQIQQQTYANTIKGERSALFVVREFPQEKPRALEAES